MAVMITHWLSISYMRAGNSLELLEKRIDTSTLPAPLPSSLIKLGCWMDSPVITMENSSGSLSVPLGLKRFLYVLLLHYQILSPETLQLSYSSILVAFFNKKGLIVEYAQLYKKTKRCVDFHKDMSHRACQTYVSVLFLPEHTKSMGIGECTCILGNFSIFKLKLF